MKPRLHAHSAATVLALSLWAHSAVAASTQPPGPGASPYAGEQTRSIKALSAGDVTGLLQGHGAGYAKAAELNGYPGPMHTLELADALQLSAEQIAASRALMDAHKQRARELGRRLVEAEHRLDALFANRLATEAAVRQATAEVGALQARLRAEHLNTHLAQTALLQPEQVRRYAELRGYGAAPNTVPTDAAPASHPHKHRH